MTSTGCLLADGEHRRTPHQLTLTVPFDIDIDLTGLDKL
jgi:hypothetical protein